MCHHQVVHSELGILSVRAFRMIVSAHSVCCPTQISQIGLMETHSVFCEVQTETLYTMYIMFSLPRITVCMEPVNA